ncbi:hypothetical protein EVAR_59545_1 [Eumeta japonica]|uniref:Uncharacterized protein n=1 Tax=Eumeta variegata TaxID=151549 RepID=A0A4C1ZW83_EUMVA|nr:hypothetical protein EVAR_59545_1 [Eumeta japonica]
MVYYEVPASGIARNFRSLITNVPIVCHWAALIITTHTSPNQSTPPPPPPATHTPIPPPPVSERKQRKTSKECKPPVARTRYETNQPENKQAKGTIFGLFFLYIVRTF